MLERFKLVIQPSLIKVGQTHAEWQTFGKLETTDKSGAVRFGRANRIKFMLISSLPFFLQGLLC